MDRGKPVNKIVEVIDDMVDAVAGVEPAVSTDSQWAILFDITSLIFQWLLDDSKTHFFYL